MSSVVTTERIRSSLASAHEQLRGSGTWWNAVQLGRSPAGRKTFVQRVDRHGCVTFPTPSTGCRWSRRSDRPRRRRRRNDRS